MAYACFFISLVNGPIFLLIKLWSLDQWHQYDLEFLELQILRLHPWPLSQNPHYNKILQMIHVHI